MKRMVYGESSESNDQLLSISAKRHIRSVTRDALSEGGYVDTDLLSRMLVGELEEYGDIEPGDSATALQEVAAVVREVKRKQK